MVSLNAKFNAEFESVEKNVKVHPIEVIGRKLLPTVIKVMSFFATFSTVRNQRFLIPTILHFCQEKMTICWVILALFANAEETAQKTYFVNVS